MGLDLYIEARIREKKKPILFCYPVITIMVFLILGLAFDLWYISWLVFLTIPIYYSLTTAINSDHKN